MSITFKKEDVFEFWNKASCGESLYLSSLTKESFNNHSKIRYMLEPYILTFADFESTKGMKVLEVGVGLGADHQKFAEAGADLFGIDLTERAISLTRHRFELYGLQSNLNQGDAENLSFSNNTFDMVYSWGVLHHSPDTEKAISEVFRVLRPGGTANIMIYYKYSVVGFMLWLRYAFLKGKPFLSLKHIYSNYLESPGTKAYSIKEAKALFSNFKDVQMTTVLTHGDLLTSAAGQTHRGPLLSFARLLWPRWFIKSILKKNGLFLLIEAKK